MNREQPGVNTEPEPEPPDGNSEQPGVNTGPIPIHPTIHKRRGRTRNGTRNREQIAALLAVDPDISLSQIVNQTGISRTRASVLRSEILRGA
jgi:hypothetical protein